MSIMKICSAYIAITILYPITIYCQTDDTTLNRLVKAWSAYRPQRGSREVFLSLNKTEFAHGDNISVAAFLPSNGGIDTGMTVLYFLLIDITTQKVVNFQRFVIVGPYGNAGINLPDSLVSGPYLVAAYTENRFVNHLAPIFTQGISVLPDRDPPPFEVRQISDTLPLQFKISIENKRLAVGGTFRYTLAADGDFIDSGRRKIDAFGEVSLPTVIKDSAPRHLVLYASVEKDKDKMNFWRYVAYGKSSWKVRYFPESGTLVNNRLTRVGVLIEDERGRPVKTHGEFYEDSTMVAVFDTDEKGMGYFDCYIDSVRRAWVRFPGLPKETIVKGEFPQAIPHGYSLRIEHSVSIDSFALEVGTPGTGTKCELLIFNKQDIAFATLFTTKAERLKFSVSIGALPAGIYTVALFDQDGTEVAERPIVKWSKPIRLIIVPDSGIYHCRSKISLQVRAINDKGQIVPFLASLSTEFSAGRTCCQAANIGDYFGEQSTILSAGSINPLGYSSLSFGPDDSAANVRGWEKVLLTYVASAQSWKAITNSENYGRIGGPTDYGEVFYRQKPVTSPVTLIVTGLRASYRVTDSSGHFALRPLDLFSSGDNPAAVTAVNIDDLKRVTIRLHNPYDSLNEQLARTYYLPPVVGPYYPKIADEVATSSEAFRLSRTLKNVVVRPKNPLILHCSDWVCMMNVLNCPNHPTGTRPERGRTYISCTGNGMPGACGFAVYDHCLLGEIKTEYTSYVRPVKPVYFFNPEYRADTALPRSAAKDYDRYLNWLPSIQSDTSGKALISFYANELPGHFIIRVQGITRGGPISGTADLVVVEKSESEVKKTSAEK